MCGIFGVIANDEDGTLDKKLRQTVEYLAKKSEARGKDSSGISLFNNNTKSIEVYKGPLPISELIKNSSVKTAINDALLKNNFGNSRYIFGHSRLVTNGTQLDSDNNQPAGIAW